ncbi:hypothetical protein GE09DRAFT_1229005 [Coniochaeta sp. 2T2.1]|nr:hypothetical protein GE09DRAFT_1229005 [Coniochaeta sp. 2T2.1]
MLPPVVHGAARAITGPEFIEALYAVTPPRFPSARTSRKRSVGLAISGGVDSMALTYLCATAHRTDAWLKLADHTVKFFKAFVVDHKLRPESTTEANAVASVLRQKLSLPTHILPIRWDREFNDPNMDTSPAALSAMPNIESLARRARYRLLGRSVRGMDITSLLVAHHEDDQYETVLMRLMGGHGTRGLRGIKGATDIPECADLHGIYQSGFYDDLKRAKPMFNLGINSRERKRLKYEMRKEIDHEEYLREMDEGFESNNHPYLHGYVAPPVSRRRIEAPPLISVDIEDGGVQIYRPLLEFGKDRLVATCLENGIPWFEDGTNNDPTLTMRNAVRCLVKEQDKLPVALRKSAVLRLAERCREKVAEEDTQAERLLSRTTIHHFEPNVGTLAVQLPELRLPTVPRRSLALRNEKRRRHYTRIAGIVVQKLLALVTPELQLTPLKDLGWVVARLFPSLSPEGKKAEEPKAFTICGVYFSPIRTPHGLRWFLSRTPYASQQRLPGMVIRKEVYTRRWRRIPSKWDFSRWSNWQSYDNRFWVSLRSRVPFEVMVAPYEAQHAKPFRELMEPGDREALDAALRKYAPGKVRYTLPAIYVRGDIEALIQGEEDWRMHEDILAGLDIGEDVSGPGVKDPRRRRSPKLKRWALKREELRQILDNKVRLVALPTLGLGIAGIESWVEWWFRYRKVELETLALATGDNYLGREMARKRVRIFRARMKTRRSGTRRK